MTLDTSPKLSISKNFVTVLGLRLLLKRPNLKTVKNSHNPESTHSHKLYMYSKNQMAGGVPKHHKDEMQGCCIAHSYLP